MVNSSPWRDVAKAARLGDMAAIEHVLEGLHGSAAEEVAFGRADADRARGRDKLPPLAEPMDLVAEARSRPSHQGFRYYPDKRATKARRR